MNKNKLYLIDIFLIPRKHLVVRMGNNQSEPRRVVFPTNSSRAFPTICQSRNYDTIFLKTLNQFREAQLFTDVVIKLVVKDGTEVSVEAHKILLHNSSKKFQDMFINEKRYCKKSSRHLDLNSAFDLKDKIIRKESLNDTILFIYGQKVELESKDQAYDLLLLASKFDLPEMFHKVYKFCRDNIGYDCYDDLFEYLTYIEMKTKDKLAKCVLTILAENKS